VSKADEQTCPNGKKPIYQVNIFLDGQKIGFANGGVIGPVPKSLPIRWQPPFGGGESDVFWVPEPGNATSHAITVRAEDYCSNESETPPTHFTIDSVSIDVIGVK
jgi:hypothetical protein